MTMCGFPGCDRRRKGRELCSGHSEQRRLGKPLTPLGKPRIKGTPDERLEGYTDKTGDCWIWTGYIGFQGYGMLGVEGKPRLAHRLMYEKVVGHPIPEGLDLDHQCRNRACVNPDHLKPTTRGENLENRGLDPRNTSGYRGVSLDKRSGKWHAYVTKSGKRYFVGRFDTAEEAGEAARLKRLELMSNNVEDRKGF